MRITACLLFFLFLSNFLMAQTFFVNPPKNTLIYVVDGIWADADSIAYDRAPSFPGGYRALYEFLGDNITITMPSQQEIQNEGGSSLLAFTLDAAGRVSDPAIINTSNPSLEYQLSLALNNMPDWEPAIVDGVNEKILVYLPLIYGVSFNQLIFDEGSGKAIVGRSKDNGWLKGLLIGGGIAIMAALFFFLN